MTIRQWPARFSPLDTKEPKMFYSKSTNGFYDKAIHADKIPADAVEITAEYHAELMTGQSGGQVIAADNKGFPRLTPPPEPTPEELRNSQNYKARAYLAETDWYVVRFVEAGTPIPEDIRAAREAARALVVE
jgi:hypothetical protein